MLPVFARWLSRAIDAQKEFVNTALKGQRQRQMMANISPLLTFGFGSLSIFSSHLP